MRRIQQHTIHVGYGLWYAAVQTADGTLHLVDQPVDSAAWALRRAHRRAEDLARAARNYRIERRFRDHFGTLYPRECRVVRILAVRAPSLQAVVMHLAGHLTHAVRRGLLAVQQVIVAALDTILTLRRQERHQRLLRLVARCTGPGAHTPSGGSSALGLIRRLIRSGRPGALALAGELGIECLATATI